MFSRVKNKLLLLKIKLKYNVKIVGKHIYINGLKLYMGENAKLELFEGASIRNNVNIRVASNANLKIGENVFINDNCCINVHGTMKIGKNSIIGQNVMIYDHDHDYKDLKNMRTNFIVENVEIGDNCWVGANVVILKGTNIGNNVVIGAGSVIKGNIEDNMLIYQKRSTERKHIHFQNM